MKRLWLSGVDGRFAMENDRVVAARCLWPLQGQLDTLPPGTVITTPSPDDWPAFSGTFSALVDAISLEWANRLNTRHGRTHSWGYWRILLMPWLTRVIMLVLRLDAEVQAAVRSLGTGEVTVELAAEEWKGPLIGDLHDLENKVLLCATFQFWLSSMLVRRRRPAHWLVETVMLPDAAVHTPTPVPPATRGRAVFHQKGFGRFTQTLLEITCRVLRGTPRDVERQTALERFAPLPVDLILAEVIDKALEASLPRLLGDDYPRYEAAAQACRFRPGGVRLANAAALNVLDITTMVIAHAFAQGERIIGVQHGTRYGLGAAVPMLSQVEYGHHAFLTFGWRQQDGHDCRAIPMPMPMLRQWHRAKAADGGILLVGTDMMTDLPRYNSEPMDCEWFGYRQAKLEFLGTLSAATYEKIRYRPGAGSTGLADMAWLRRHLPGIPEATGLLEPLMMKASLVVMDHPGTPLSTLLAADVPVVCFWDAKQWPMCASAEERFDALRRCGILHDSAAAAATHVDRIIADVEGWWRSAPVQQARKSWCEAYARSSAWWPLQWLWQVFRLTRGPRHILAGTTELPVPGKIRRAAQSGTERN